MVSLNLCKEHLNIATFKRLTYYSTYKELNIIPSKVIICRSYELLKLVLLIMTHNIVFSFLCKFMVTVMDNLERN